MIRFWNENGAVQSCRTMFELASLLLLLQNMLLEIEEKVLALSELSRDSENLLLEGRPENRDDAEQLTRKLRTLKGSLLELQRMLQDKQINIQVGLDLWIKAGNLDMFVLEVHLGTLEIKNYPLKVPRLDV